MLNNFIPIIFSLLIISSSFANSIDIYISSDWEGIHLVNPNIYAMKKFNRTFPKVGITHFLNAAYYTNNELSKERVSNLIGSTIKPGDTFGLHIHGWNSLFKKAGVKFREGPSWEVGYHCDLDSSLDCGHDVPINLYEISELQKVVRFSLKTLKSHGFYPIKSFRAGGWMADRNVLKAIALEGINIDSSAVDAMLLHSKLPKEREFRFYEFLSPIWPSINWSSQPMLLTLENNLSILEYPNNGLFADYLSTDEMFKIYLANTELLKKDLSTNRIISYGFHQETADRFLRRIELLIGKIRKDSTQRNISIRFLTL